MGDLVEVRELNNTTMTAGPGCAQIDARVVRCRGVQNINANGRGGNDVLDNKTSLTSVLNGEADATS